MFKHFFVRIRPIPRRLLKDFFAISAITSLVGSTSIERRTGQWQNQNCPGLLCCKATGYPNDPIPTMILALLGIVVADPSILVGVFCTTISSIGDVKECHDKDDLSTVSVSPLTFVSSLGGTIAIDCVTI
ncbi:hypothetical protein L218DRAFT_944693 [Marasmius fiardii PR-910]|nr:hypothetical protein L218DRAFT_944693 [Marasmius fiardii PR-910]